MTATQKKASELYVKERSLKLVFESDDKEPIAGFERDGEVWLWKTRRLWELSKDLPIFEYSIEKFDCFDKDVWFGKHQKPTLTNILKHYKKIENANFDYPIILNQDGVVLDGVHRICRASLLGLNTIPAVKFKQDPGPDRVTAT